MCVIVSEIFIDVYRVKAANFDVDWEVEDDSKLLRGVYQYGMGSWEAIKMDPGLGISDKILLNDDKKPQAKHLQARTDYLLKILKNMLERKQGVVRINDLILFVLRFKFVDWEIFASYTIFFFFFFLNCSRLRNFAWTSVTNNNKPIFPQTKPKKQRKGRENKTALTKPIIEHEEASSGEENTNASEPGSKKRVKVKSESSEVKTEHDKEGHAVEPGDEKKEEKKKQKRERKESKSKKKAQGPMHFTANSEPRALDVMGDLEPAIFDECKEKMRPVKKALKALDNPDESLNEQDQVSHTRQCLLQIGDQINNCLNEYKDPEKVKEWRRLVQLWIYKINSSINSI